MQDNTRQSPVLFFHDLDRGITENELTSFVSPFTTSDPKVFLFRKRKNGNLLQHGNMIDPFLSFQRLSNLPLVKKPRRSSTGVASLSFQSEIARLKSSFLNSARLVQR